MNDNITVDIRLDADDSFVLTVLMPVAPRVGEVLWPARSTSTEQERLGAFEVKQVAHHCRPSGVHSCVVYVRKIGDSPISLPPLEQLVLARWLGSSSDTEQTRWGVGRRMPVVDGISRWERWIESDDTADWIHWDDPVFWMPLPDTNTMNRTRGATA